MRGRFSSLVFVLLAGALAGGCNRASIEDRRPDRIIGEQGLGPGQFMHPRSMATSPDGCVFVVDKTARIQRFGPDGEFQLLWQMPEWEAGKPTGLTVDKTGRVLVADTHYSRVIIYDRDGHELARFGQKGFGPGEFSLPTDVVVDDDGNYYVSEYGGNDRISKFNARFEYLLSFGGHDGGEAALNRPQAMVMDKEGVLWVADACDHRICRFTRDGKFLGAFGTAGRQRGQIEYPYGLDLLPDGTILVCEFGNNRLQRFDRSGRSLEVWGSPGRRPGQLASPWAVALGAGQRVYVVDYLNHRVQMFRM